MKKILIAWISFLSMFSISSVFAADGINYLDWYTKVNKSTYNYDWSVDIETSWDKVWYKTVAVDQTNNKTFTLDVSGKNIHEYTNGVNTKTISFIDSTSPVFNTVKMVYQPTTQNIYIMWVTGNGTYKFPTNSALTIDNANKALFIITYSTTQNKVIDTFSIGAWNGNVLNSFNIDDLNNIYINAWIDTVTSSEWNVTIIDKDWIINASAVFSGTTMITSTQNIDGVNWLIAWKMDNGSSFIQKINLQTMSGTWFALEINNADISDIFYNSTNNRTYALLSFTWSKQINWISYTNTTWTDSVVVVLDDTFATVRSFQIAGDWEINVKRFKQVEDNEILLYGDYTSTLSNPIIWNRGWKDWIMLKLRNGTTETDFVWIATFTKTGDNVISDLNTDGWTYYYAIIDDKVFQLWNNLVNKDTGICGTWFIAVRDTVMVDITTWKYNYWTTNQRATNSSNADKLDDYIIYDSILAGSDHSTYNHIVNLAYIVDWVKYSDGIATKWTSTIGWTTNGSTFANNFWTTYKTELQENLYKAMMNGTPLAWNNGLSYNDFYKYKGIHPAMLFNQHPTYNLDYNDSVNLTTANSKSLVLEGKYIWWRNFHSERAVVDDINKSLTKKSNNVITQLQLGWVTDPLFWANYHYPLLPIKSVSNGTTDAYLQYSCWNMICNWTQCFGWDKEKSQCWNGKLDWVELCDGSLFKDMDKVWTLKWLGYDVSCNSSCNIKIAAWTTTSSQYPMSVLRCEPIPIPWKDILSCGDWNPQTKAEKDLAVAADPTRLASDNVDEVCDSEVWCDPKTCTFPVYNEKCWDGIVQSLFDKQTNFKANPSTYSSDYLEETCDDGNTNNTDSCLNSCMKPPIPTPIPTPPIPFELWSCGNGKVDQVWEMCDDGNTNDTDSCKNSCILNWVDEKVFCWNNKIDAILNETCDWDDRNPIWYNPAGWETCTSCVKWIPPPPTPWVCWDGTIGERADWNNETCDLGTATAGDWSKAGCGYPTIADPSSNTGWTLPNPNACYKAVCWNEIIEDTEICDQWLNNWTGIFKDWFSCNATCSINKNENPTCGNGKIDVITNASGATTVEQCDNGSKNDWTTKVWSVTCSNKCEVVLSCDASGTSSTSLNSKYNFLYIQPITNWNKLEIWSYNPQTELFSKKRAILPTTAEFAKFYGSTESSNYTDQELALWRTTLEKGLTDIANANILTRYNGSFLNLNKRVQLLTNDSKEFTSLSFSLSEINQKSWIIRKFLFKQWLTSIEPYKFEISTTSCSTDEPETQWEVNIIWVINGDTDSIYLVKNFGEYIPNNPYVSSY